MNTELTAAICHNQGMSNHLKEWRLSRDLTLEQVANAIGTDKTQVSKLERGDRRLSTDWLERLAKFYAVQPAALLQPPPARGGMSDRLLTGPGDVEANAGARIAVPPVGAMPLDVPVFGVAVGGSDGDFSLNGEEVDRVRRPPGLAGNKKAFAVFVRGDSMEPRHMQGDLLYVDPMRPARSGDDVLVELKPTRPGEPGAAMIKQLVIKTPLRVVLRQFNPAKEFTVPGDKILRVSLILKMADLLGV